MTISTLWEEIWKLQQKLASIRHPPKCIDRHPPVDIDRHPPVDIDRHPGLDELRRYILIEARMYKFEATHHAVPTHPRPLICAEDAGFHKRVKRIHDPVKIVVPCAVFEVKYPIPPDRSVHLGSYNGIFDDHMYAVASQRGLRFRGEIDKGPTEAALIVASTSSSIDIGCLSEQEEFEVCQNLFDGSTTTQPDKFGGKNRKNWKKRKRTKRLNYH